MVLNLMCILPLYIHGYSRGFRPNLAHIAASFSPFVKYSQQEVALVPQSSQSDSCFLCLGELPGFSKAERDELARMLTTMIEEGQSVMCANRGLYEEAMRQYVKYRNSRYAQENDPLLIAERKSREEEERKKAISVRIDTLTQYEAHIISCENLCNSTMQLLDIRRYLHSRGWTQEQSGLAVMQIIARAIYPYSELKTVRYLQENTALAEMFGIVSA